jgi:hypothetical protein
VLNYKENKDRLKGNSNDIVTRFERIRFVKEVKIVNRKSALGFLCN